MQNIPITEMFSNLKGTHKESLSERESALGYNYTVLFIARFFCNDATLLCEFESDKIRINEF